jgi:hypothetical protein
VNCLRGRVLGSIAVGAAIAATSTPAGTGATGSDAIPLLGMPPTIYGERDMPPAVQARVRRAARAALARARAVAKLKPTASAGCVATDYAGVLGPPAPTVTARIFGRHVEVVVRFARLPDSPVCRPVVVRVTTHGTTTTFRPFPWSVDFRLRGPVGRAVIRLPPYAKAPYRLTVTTGAAGGRISKEIEQPLSCPSDGCMRSESYSPASARDPHRVLPLRGVARDSLEKSFRDAITVNRQLWHTVRDIRCPTVKRCQATYADPLYPRMPYRVRYSIEGEQRAGCWMARDATRLDPLPYEDTYTGSIVPAGCVSWLR